MANLANSGPHVVGLRDLVVVVIVVVALPGHCDMDKGHWPPPRDTTVKPPTGLCIKVCFSIVQVGLCVEPISHRENYKTMT